MISYFSYASLGSDLLPKLDEGDLYVDYIMPPGSSLAETDRVVDHVVQIIRSIPEVKATSRRTGLQLGLAAVTEANTGDISVNLTSHRSRDIYEIMDEVQDKVSRAEPALDIDLHQTLEDMIGDLTNAPQPVDIKLFSEDPDLLRHWAPIVADKISTVPGVVGVLNGIDEHHQQSRDGVSHSTVRDRDQRVHSGGGGDGCRRAAAGGNGAHASGREQSRV